MKVAATYYRVSTEEQAHEGQSIETQKKLCLRWAHENGYKIVGEYIDEGKSATNLNRPALRKLLARCQEDKAVQAVLIQDTDRWARSTLDHLSTKSLLKKYGVKLISISQPMIDDSPEGNFIDVVLAGANALQSQITGRKTAKVMAEKAKAGYWPGWAPIGYKNFENPSPNGNLDRRIVVPDKDVAPLIKKLFELYATGNFSVESLRDVIHKRGLRSRMGKKLQVSSVHRILSNPFYYGVVPWRGKIYPGKHTPIINKVHFDGCQKVRALHNQYASRKRKHDMLLRGLVFCNICGSRYWGGPHKNGQYYYYFCKACGGGTYTQADGLETQIEKQFDRLEVTPEYAQEVVDTAKDIVAECRKLTESDRIALQNRRTKIELKMREAEDNLLDKTLSKDSFKRIYSRLENELVEINNQLISLDTDYGQSIHSIERLMGLAENIGEAYKEADMELKRCYLGLFFQKFLVENGEIVESTPSDALKPLLGSKVRVRSTWLPGEDLNL